MVFLIIISMFTMFVSLRMLGGARGYFIEWEIIRFNTVKIEVVLIFDWISMIFISFVSFISSMVLYYRGSYIGGDKNVNRFMYLVLAFVCSMVFLIVSPNLIRILLGWDGLGLVSYALVIYYQNEKRRRAGMLTALSNRVGDVCILLGISLIVVEGRWNLLYNQSLILVRLVSLVVLARITKSAQIPFSAWLPAAIAAPTPVSALVHSSTLVTAGVYLLIRFSSWIEGSIAGEVLLILSRLTIFIAGLGANFETDLKKIIALSTLSQLGLMIMILSMGRPMLAFFHLLSHALFKALLFIGAGSIIHSVGDYQDVRVIGGLVNVIPLRVTVVNLANLSLCGMLFIRGFYSKDLILEVSFMRRGNLLVFFLLVLSTGLTVCYTFRFIFMRLSGDFNLKRVYVIRDESSVITRPIIGLAAGGVIGGCCLSWIIFPFPEVIVLSRFYKILALMVRFVGGAMGYILNFVPVGYTVKSIKMVLVNYVGSIWFLPYLSTYGVSLIFLKEGYKYQYRVDMGWLEYYGGQGVYKNISRVSSNIQIVQDNNIKVYMIVLLLWLLVLVLIV